MSFLGLPQLSARSEHIEERKLVNRITSQLSTFIDDAAVGLSVSEFCDLTVVKTVEVVSPRIGFYYLPLAAWFYQKTTTGAATGAPTLACGNNGSTSNVVPSASAPTTGNFGIGAPSLVPLTLATTFSLVDMQTPILAAVTSKATGTGTFAWNGFVLMVGSYFVK